MAKTPRGAIDETTGEGGQDPFTSAPLAGFPANAGRGQGKAGLPDAASQTANADALGRLPAIPSTPDDLDDDSDEFAALLSDMAAKTHNGPAHGQFLDFLADLGSGRPKLAARLARRLIKTGGACYAAFLVGGAMRRAPAPCNDIAASLMRSRNAEEAEAGVKCLRIAWKRDGIADAASGIRTLASVASRPDGVAAGEAMDALVDLYPAAGKAEEVGRMIENLARRHAASRCRLARRIRHATSPFDDATALRLLTTCAGGEPDFQTLDEICMALARLSKSMPDAAIKIVVDLLDAEIESDYMGDALQELGRTRPGPLTTAVLAKFGADCTPGTDMRLGSIVGDIAEHADPGEIMDALFAALDSGGVAARSSLLMINTMVTPNCDATHDAELASRTLRRLVRYAQANGINVEHVLKKERDACLKCAAVVHHIMHPPVDVDKRRVMENLEIFPALKNAFGPRWFRKEAEKGQAPHPLVGCLSDLSLERIESLLVVPPGETPPERFDREFRLWYESGPFDTLAFLDMALALLEEEMGTTKYVRHMKNPDQFMDTVAEIALVVPFVAKQHRVELEPSIGKKQLDAAVELDPQRVLVEVLSPRPRAQLKLLDGFREIPAGRVAGRIRDKVVGQLLASGTRGDPIVIAIDTSRSETTWDIVADYVLGPLTCTFFLNPVTGRTMAYSAARDAEKCMHWRDARTDLISAVVCFAPTMSADPSAAVEGMIIENPYAKVPLAPATRDALARILQCSLLNSGGQGGGGTR